MVRPFLLAVAAAAAAATSACAQAPLPVLTASPVTSDGFAFASSGNAAFDAWRRDFARRSLARGVSRSAIVATLSNTAPIASVQRANDSQPEFVRPVWDYLAGAVSSSRIAEGRSLLAVERAIVDRATASTGVPGAVAVAIWGMETSYGKVLGSFDVPSALATLAYQGRRTAFGEAELLAVMRMIERGEATRPMLRGSWAGAMGHTQFIPSTFLAYAVDGDGDGRRDIWRTPHDALASTAAYLGASGWRAGEPWGRPVTLPVGFDYALADGVRRPVSDWQARGVQTPPGLDPAWEARLLLPTGRRGPAFLMGRNFDVIRVYNASDSYAMAVGLLSDAIAGGPAPSFSWPVDDPPIPRSQVRELQGLLTTLGFDTGGVDGQAGPRTRTALQRFQAARNEPADGYPGASALLAVRLAAGTTLIATPPQPGSVTGPPPVPAPR
jgi:membrane-bound lytic murein transglycosylase B